MYGNSYLYYKLQQLAIITFVEESSDFNSFFINVTRFIIAKTSNGSFLAVNYLLL